MSDYVYHKTNGRGEACLRQTTDKTLEEVTDYLDSLDIPYEIRENARMMWIGTKGSRQFFSYYYTTGRWAAWSPYGLPKKHYHSKGIKDFISRFYFGGKKSS